MNPPARPEPRFLEAPAPVSPATVLPIVGEQLVFARRGRTLLDDVSVRLEGSGLTVVLGPNGAGKSLLIRVLAGLLNPDAGDVSWAGRPPDSERRAGLAMVFQKPILLRRSVVENVIYALAAARWPRPLQRDGAEAALAVAGLTALADTPARLLSGGEQQRLALVRALALRPAALLLDEPTAHLDPASSAAIEGLVQGACADGTKVCWVTHDLNQAQRLGEEIVFMHAGAIRESQDAASFFAAPKTAEAADYLAGKLLT